MGNKYASIHVYGDDTEKMLNSIKGNYIDEDDNMHWNNLLNEMKQTNPEVYKRLVNLSNQRFGDILLISTDGRISIYDESNSFETIHSKAKKISKKIDSLVTYTSNFDDDVFIIGVYKSGTPITSGNFGDGLSVYGMKHKDINMDKLCQVLHINKTEELISVNSLKNINSIEEIIEKHLKIKLNLYLEEVKSSKAYMAISADDIYHTYVSIP